MSSKKGKYVSRHPNAVREIVVLELRITIKKLTHSATIV